MLIDLDTYGYVGQDSEIKVFEVHSDAELADTITLNDVLGILRRSQDETEEEAHDEIIEALCIQSCIIPGSSLNRDTVTPNDIGVEEKMTHAAKSLGEKPRFANWLSSLLSKVRASN